VLDSLGDNRYNDWELGLLLQVPIGFREGNAEVARAKLLLAQRFVFLRDQEGKVVLSLQRSHRAVVQRGEEIRIQRSQREAAAVQLRVPEEKFRAGKETIDFLLQAQRNWADAVRDEYLTVCRYNVALADYERQKGTILGYDNVSLLEGPVPTYALGRASAHIRERDRAIDLSGLTHTASQGRLPPRADSSGPVDFRSLLREEPETSSMPVMLPPVPLE